MAKNIWTLSLLGHKQIVAVMGAAHINGVEEALHDFSQRRASSESGEVVARHSIYPVSNACTFPS